MRDMYMEVLVALQAPAQWQPSIQIYMSANIDGRTGRSLPEAASSSSVHRRTKVVVRTAFARDSSMGGEPGTTYFSTSPPTHSSSQPHSPHPHPPQNAPNPLSAEYASRSHPKQEHT